MSNKTCFIGGQVGCGARPTVTVTFVDDRNVTWDRLAACELHARRAAEFWIGPGLVRLTVEKLT